MNAQVPLCVWKSDVPVHPESIIVKRLPASNRPLLANTPPTRLAAAK